MAETGKTKRSLRQPSELTSAYDFLEEVRLRPGMWVRGGSLQHLDSMLWGYLVALEVHGINEVFDFASNQGPFAEWLWKRLGMSYPSALSWSAEIERAARRRGMSWLGRPAPRLWAAALGRASKIMVPTSCSTGQIHRPPDAPKAYGP